MGGKFKRAISVALSGKVQSNPMVPRCHCDLNYILLKEYGLVFAFSIEWVLDTFTPRLGTVK